MQGHTWVLVLVLEEQMSLPFKFCCFPVNHSLRLSAHQAGEGARGGSERRESTCFPKELAASSDDPSTAQTCNTMAVAFQPVPH